MQNNIASIPIELSVVAPCFNEADTIETFIKLWTAHLLSTGLAFEILIVNDGSTEGTGRIVDKIRRGNPNVRVLHQLNTGHQDAVRRGYALARGKYILQLDANGRYEPSDFDKFWEELKYHKLLIAHRTNKMDSFFRRFLADSLQSIAKFLFGISLEEPGVSFRLFERECTLEYLEKLPIQFKSINMAMSILMKKDIPDLVNEVKIPFRKRNKGESRTSFLKLISITYASALELINLRWIFKRKSILPTSLVEIH